MALKKFELTKEEGVKKFENLLGKKPEEANCKIIGDQVVCYIKYPYQRKGAGEWTEAIVKPVKVRDIKGIKIVSKKKKLEEV